MLIHKSKYIFVGFKVHSIINTYYYFYENYLIEDAQMITFYHYQRKVYPT